MSRVMQGLGPAFRSASKLRQRARCTCISSGRSMDALPSATSFASIIAPQRCSPRCRDIGHAGPQALLSTAGRPQPGELIRSRMTASQAVVWTSASSQHRMHWICFPVRAWERTSGKSAMSQERRLPSGSLEAQIADIEIVRNLNIRISCHRARLNFSMAERGEARWGCLPPLRI